MAQPDEPTPALLLELESIVCGVVTANAWGPSLLDRILDAEMFSDQRHRTLWLVMREMNDERKSLSRDSLVQQLTLSRRLELAGGVDYVRALPGLYDFEEATTYAEQLLRFGSLRLVQLVGRQLATTKQAEKAEAVLQTALTSLSKTQQALVVKKTATYRDALAGALGQMRYASQQTGGLVGLDTGLRSLNDVINGMQPGKLYIIAGRPSMGKSVVAAHIARAMARDPRSMATRKKVLIVSLEMGDAEFAARDISQATHIPGERLGRGWLPSGLSRETFENIVQQKMGETGILFDTEITRLREIQAKARRYHAEGILCGVVIDYLQLVSADGENRTQEVGAISRALKGLAKELDVPVVALSQVSRGVEARNDKRPQLSDLRESGDIEQDADVVIFLYRPDAYKDCLANFKGLFEFIVAKQRGGSKETVIVKHDIECSLLWDDFTEPMDHTTHRPLPLIDVMPRQQQLPLVQPLPPGSEDTSYDEYTNYRAPGTQISSASLGQRDTAASSKPKKSRGPRHPN